MANEKRPAHPVHLMGLWPPRGWAYEYTVKNDDNWWSLARKFRMDDEWQLIEYNFRTRVPEEVNWYLRELVGCWVGTPDGNNYRFLFALPTKRKIYIPPGDARRDHTIYEEVIKDLRREIESSNDPHKKTYLCFLTKLENNGDDRVILWEDIAPGPHALAPPFVRRRLTEYTPGVTEDWLFKNIKSQADVESQPVRQGLVGHGKFVTSMRKALFDPVETKLVGLRGMRAQIIEAHNTLDNWANVGIGGQSGMPRYYRAIKEWMRGKESNVDSVLSCVRPP
jgi:hypothetical protein